MAADAGMAAAIRRPAQRTLHDSRGVFIIRLGGLELTFKHQRNTRLASAAFRSFGRKSANTPGALHNAGITDHANYQCAVGARNPTRILRISVGVFWLAGAGGFYSAGLARAWGVSPTT